MYLLKKESSKFLSALIVIIPAFISIIGAAMIFSIESKDTSFAINHLIATALFSIGSILIKYIPNYIINQVILLFYIGTNILLGLVILIGHWAMGAQRWIKLSGISFQPSEIIKLAIVMILSKILSQKSPREMSLKDIIFITIIIFVPFVLIVLQPNLGTAMIFFLINCYLLFIWGFPTNLIIIISSVIICSSPIVWSSMHEYQKKRVLVFLSPDMDKQGAGYNSIQSQIAIGSGMMYGEGFMRGKQSKLKFLPEQRTDFILSVIAEEFGFIGVSFIISLYIVVIFILYIISKRMNNYSSKFIVLGVGFFIFIHVTVNACMISGILPITGTPLPFLSYGRSNLLSGWLGIGFVLRAINYDKDFKGTNMRAIKSDNNKISI